MKNMLLILLVVVFTASVFAIAACSKPEPAAQPSSPDAQATNPDASIPASPVAFEKEPEVKTPAPVPTVLDTIQDEQTPLEKNYPEPSMDKKIWPKK